MLDKNMPTSLNIGAYSSARDVLPEVGRGGSIGTGRRSSLENY